MRDEGIGEVETGTFRIRLNNDKEHFFTLSVEGEARVKTKSGVVAVVKSSPAVFRRVVTSYYARGHLLLQSIDAARVEHFSSRGKVTEMPPKWAGMQGTVLYDLNLKIHSVVALDKNRDYHYIKATDSGYLEIGNPEDVVNLMHDWSLAVHSVLDRVQMVTSSKVVSPIEACVTMVTGMRSKDLADRRYCNGCFLNRLNATPFETLLQNGPEIGLKIEEKDHVDEDRDLAILEVEPLNGVYTNPLDSHRFNLYRKHFVVYDYRSGLTFDPFAGLYYSPMDGFITSTEFRERKYRIDKYKYGLMKHYSAFETPDYSRALVVYTEPDDDLDFDDDDEGDYVPPNAS